MFNPLSQFIGDDPFPGVINMFGDGGLNDLERVSWLVEVLLLWFCHFLAMKIYYQS